MLPSAAIPRTFASSRTAPSPAIHKAPAHSRSRPAS